jgi:hypothetical protein
MVWTDRFGGDRERRLSGAATGTIKGGGPADSSDEVYDGTTTTLFNDTNTTYHKGNTRSEHAVTVSIV